MPKTPSNKLFRLVKSLLGSEKRYFKIFIHNKIAKDNKYLLLFEAIEKQEVFDDYELQKEVYKGEKIESRKYSELKGYLYDLILKSLQSYDEKTSIEYKLKGMLLSIQTLFKRSLFEDCKQVLHKAKKIAVKYEKFTTVLELLNWEKHIAYTETDIAYLDKELERIIEEEKLLVLQIKNISKYRNIFFRILINLRKDASPNKRKQLTKLQLFEKDAAMSNIENAESHTAKTLFYRGLSIYHYASQDLPRFYTTSTLLVAHMESKKYLLLEDTSEYISALSNHVIACGSMQKIEEVKATLGKLKEVKPNIADDEVKIFRQYYMAKFRLCINTGAFEEGYKELQTHLKESPKFDQKLFNKNTFYLQYFSICFGVEKYDEALGHLNDWLSISKNIERQDLQSLARILNLIIHYEINNIDLLHSLIRSAYRFLNDKNFLVGFEKTFLNSLREAKNLQSRKELKNHWQQLKKEYDALISDSKTPAILRWFPIEEWIISKIENKPFSKIVKENFEKNHPPK